MFALGIRVAHNTWVRLAFMISIVKGALIHGAQRVPLDCLEF